MKKYFLKKLLKKMDSLCSFLSAKYKFPDEAYEIRKIISKIEEKNKLREKVEDAYRYNLYDF